MKNEIEHFEFRKDMYFYEYVLSFSVSLCGCPVIFEKSIPLYLQPDQLLTFVGKHSGIKNMRPYGLRRKAEQGFITKEKYLETCCTMLANTAYESVKRFNDNSEIFEFFRHIRNASSHLNQFNFNHKEPSLPAVWRTAKIDHLQKGELNPLFNKPCFGYFMGVTDILELLMDIENKIIAYQDIGENTKP